MSIVRRLGSNEGEAKREQGKGKIVCVYSAGELCTRARIVSCNLGTLGMLKPSVGFSVSILKEMSNEVQLAAISVALHPAMKI